MGAGNVRKISLPDHPHANVVDPPASLGHVRDLENGHVAAIAASAVEVPTCCRVGLYRRNDLDEGVPHREDRVLQPELQNPWVVERVIDARPERVAQGLDHRTEVAGNERDLAESGAEEQVGVRAGDRTPAMRR